MCFHGFCQVKKKKNFREKCERKSETGKRILCKLKTVEESVENVDRGIVKNCIFGRKQLRTKEKTDVEKPVENVDNYL